MFRFTRDLNTVIDCPFVTAESLKLAIAQGVRPIPVSLGKRHLFGSAHSEARLENLARLEQTQPAGKVRADAEVQTRAG